MEQTMRKKILLLFLPLALASALMSSVGFAQGISSPNLVLLILDNSGSMKDNDPENLRFTAARMFLSLLDEGTSAGVIVFSTTSHPQFPAITAIGDLQERRQLLNEIQPTPAGGYTDVKAAFKDAQKLLADYQVGSGTGVQPVVILLTDGQPQIEKPYSAYESETLALIESLHVPVYSIALTRSAETAFLNQVAIITGGSIISANNAADLLHAYLQVFSQIQDRTIVELGIGQAPDLPGLELDPALAPLVEQVSFVIAWSGEGAGAVHLVSPDGQTILEAQPGTAFQMFSDPQFTVLTLRRPAAGAWRLESEGQSAYVAYAILHTRLRIHLRLPDPIIESGQALPIRLVLVEEQQDGTTIPVLGEANFSAVVTLPDGSQVRLDQFYDDGSHGDRQANDGEFTRILANTRTEGAYQVQVQGWKGLTPLSTSGQIQAVHFPRLILDEPLEQPYTIRGEPIWLRLHWAGNPGDRLEPGGLVTHLTAPSGLKFEISLESSSQGYQAAFTPVENGTYQVEIETSAAAFLGVPFSRSLAAHFQVKIIPALALQDRPIDLGRVELNQAIQGIPFPVRAASTSAYIETLQVRLEGIANFSVKTAAPLQVFPGLDNELNLVIIPQASLAPGVYHGMLVFAARPDLDLTNPRVPVQVEIYQPALKFGMPTLRAVNQACPGWESSLQIPFLADLFTQETVNLRLESQDQALYQALRLSSEQIVIRPGDQQLSVRLQGSLPAGKFKANVIVEGRPGLHIEPAVGIPLVLDIPPVWVRCKKPIGLGVGIWFAVALSGLILGGRIRAHNKPPFVTGTMRHWSVHDPGQAIEIDLTGLHKSEVLIGQVDLADVNFTDPDLAPMHALLKIDRNHGNEQLVLEPVAPIRRGYRKVEEAFPLNHTDTFQIGQRQLQYLSDHPFD
jgi:uncharacterized protein YegL